MICPPVTARLISLSAQSTLVSSLLRSVMTSLYSNVPTHSEQRAAFPSFTNCSGYLKLNYLVWIYAHHRMKPCMCTEQIHSSCTEGYRDIMYRTCCHMGISVTPYSYPLMGKYQRSVCCRKAQGCIYIGWPSSFGLSATAVRIYSSHIWQRLIAFFAHWPPNTQLKVRSCSVTPEAFQ